MNDKADQNFQEKLIPESQRFQVSVEHPIPPIVGIGASAGGVEALKELFRNLTVDSRLAFVVIQHLDPTHESLLAEILSRETQMSVQQAMDGMKVESDHVYIVPPNACMKIEGNLLRIEPRSESRGVHMPIDFFLHSLAQNHGNRAMGIILSGTGSDGTLGIKDIKERGGITFAQDLGTAKFSGMPQSAISTGSVDFTLSIREITQEILRIAHHPYVSSVEQIEGEASPSLPPIDQNYLKEIFNLLRGMNGSDFTHYKLNTIQRRIIRRMTFMKMERPGDYLFFLRNNPDELKALYHDLLIKVTGFFRDPETFEELKNVVIPRILAHHSFENPIRIWVPGCATGEEAYSIAICFLECFGEKKIDVSLQIFATDIDEVALHRARAGLYVENIAADVSPERLQRFFVKVDRHFRINQAVREKCTFAKHDVSRDPPFSKIDFISCRNVLIYFDLSMQKRVIPIFHYALNPTGFLALGPAETIGTLSKLFEPEGKKHRLYSKRIGFANPIRGFPSPQPPTIEANGDLPREKGVEDAVKATDICKEADRVLLNYAPAGVLINEEMEILQFRGDTSRYLLPPHGKACLNLLKMLREGLLVEIKTSLEKAKSTNADVSREDVLVRFDGNFLRVTLKVIPISRAGSVHHFMILFEESPPSKTSPIRDFLKFLLKSISSSNAHMEAAQQRIRQEAKLLREELDAAREYLQSTIEKQDATNEELKAANEEILSSNEELQSTNEELETSKEELQSTNEELSTVNEELLNRNSELFQTNNDLNNLFSSANLPILMLGKDLRIRRFTLAGEKTLNLLPSDLGRPLEHLRLNIDIPDLQGLLSACIENGRMQEREVQARDGHWYCTRILPYKSEGKIEGAILFFIDIDSLKGAEKLADTLKKLQDVRAYGEAIVESIRQPLLILDTHLSVVMANPAFCKTFQISKEEAEGKLIYSLGNGQWNMSHLRRVLEDILPGDAEISDFQVEHHFPTLGDRVMCINARRLSSMNLILLAMEDITDRKSIERQAQDFNNALEEKVVRRTQELKSSNLELEAFSSSIAHDLRTPLRSIVSFSQLLEAQKVGSTPEAQSYLEHIVNSAKHMTKLIDHLLELSRVTRRVINRETIDLSAEAQAIAHEFSRLQPDRQVDFRIATGLIAEGDRSLLRLLLQNLFDNAWKFSSKTAHAVIEFDNTFKEGREVFFVRDNGVGFDMAYANKLFGLFQRLHDEKDFPGTGIGLATVQRIIHRHGGEIWVDSEVNHGAMFYFTLKKSSKV